jgi:phosphate binding protein
MKRVSTAAIWLAVLALVLAACGGSEGGASDDTAGGDDTTTTTAAQTTTTAGGDDDMGDGDMEGPFTGETHPLTGLPIIDPLEVEGDVLIAGSSTVFPLSTAVLERWIDEGGPEYSIDSVGSGGGLERFCVEGASDIANASRAIEQEEIDACTETWGGPPIEIRVGSDALSLVISSGNYFAQELTLEEIATAFSLTDPNATWADVNPEFPAHPIELFSPGTDSGTFDYFNEVVFDEADPSPIVSSIAQIVGEDDNVTVQGVGGDGCTEGDLSSTCAIGYFGYAFFVQNSDVLQAVSVEGVPSSEETVNDGSYPISRPLFMYTSEAVLAEKPQVAYFIAYYLNNVNEVIDQVGYFPAPDERIVEAAENLASAAGWR